MISKNRAFTENIHRLIGEIIAFVEQGERALDQAGYVFENQETVLTPNYHNLITS